MLMKGDSVVNFLVEVDKDLAKLERDCILELPERSSPQELGKAIYVVRNKIESTIANMGEHLRSFRQYRRKGKAQGKKGRQLQKLHKKSSGRWSYRII